MQPENSSPHQIHLFPPTSCQPSLSDSTKGEREGMKRKTGRHELYSLLISCLPASMADDHKQGTHTLSYHTDNFIIQSLHQQVIMEHQLPALDLVPRRTHGKHKTGPCLMILGGGR